MKLFFPNLRYQEGKTICQFFMVDFLRFIRDKKNLSIKTFDLENMLAEIEGDMDLNTFFVDYLDHIFKESLEIYPFTQKMIGRGKSDLAKKAKNWDKLDEFTKNIFEPTGETKLVEMKEKLLAGHIVALNKVKKQMKKCRCVQSDDEKGECCKVCGLVGGKKADITERISLSADKCWKPLVTSESGYEQLKGCVRCALVLGIINNMRSLWRINIAGKDRKTRYALIPSFKIDRDPKAIDKMWDQFNLLTLFRIRQIGRTSTDYIFNSFKAQPIIAKMVAEGLLDLTLYTQSKEAMGGYVTSNVITPDRIRKISEFAVLINRYFPKYPYANADARLDSPQRIQRIQRSLSDGAYLYKKDSNRALCEFFTNLGPEIKFDVVLEILGGNGTMKVEYWKDKEKIRQMNEYGWDNPIVRVCTMLIAERATKKDANRKPDQIINEAMAIFNTVPEKEKNKKIRKFLEKITGGGTSYIWGKIDQSEEFLSELNSALNECNADQLKGISRFMRMFAMSYMYKPRSEKETIFKETLKELGYDLKKKEVE